MIEIADEFKSYEEERLYKSQVKVGIVQAHTAIIKMHARLDEIDTQFKRYRFYLNCLICLLVLINLINLINLMGK